MLIPKLRIQMRGMHRLASNKRILVALGGNALQGQHDTGKYEDQAKTVRKAVDEIYKIIKGGWLPIITHGNGPQVGALLLQNLNSKNIVPPLPLYALVAQSQASIGLQIQQQLFNILRKKRSTQRS
eukprot:Colp12_sorted_trinity150504_noHs@9434